MFLLFFFCSVIQRVAGFLIPPTKHQFPGIRFPLQILISHPPNSFLRNPNPTFPSPSIPFLILYGDQLGLFSQDPIPIPIPIPSWFSTPQYLKSGKVSISRKRSRFVAVFCFAVWNSGSCFAVEFPRIADSCSAIN